MIFHKKNKRDVGEVDFENLPRHIAIIMDGNGRWAQRRGLPRTAGHAAGAETFRTIANYCKKIGIPYLTAYAFSTENWRRPLEEVTAIMGLLKKYLLEALEELEADKIRVCFLGDLSPLSEELQELCLKIEKVGNNFVPLHQVNICLNYGGRDEILRAARACAADCVAGRLEPEKLTEGDLSRYLYSAELPDPDLIIRPSGEFRVSNFLLWQGAYSELYFTDVLWPDFNETDLNRALHAYQGRKRRFGGI